MGPVPITLKCFLGIGLTNLPHNVTFFHGGNTMTDTLERFSISMKGDLLRQLDNLVKVKGYANRSQAISDMVKGSIVEHQGQQPEREIAGSITLVYDHHKRNIQALLTKIQHDYGAQIIATLHAHLDHHNCMELLAVRGKARDVKKLADRLQAAKGIKHGKLTVTTSGEIHVL
jgi:CopG family transcriptional regulator, nickel-responsive regulator